jgi:hypothetical protein
MFCADRNGADATNTGLAYAITDPGDTFPK